MGLIKISKIGWLHFQDVFFSQDIEVRKKIDLTSLLKLVLIRNKIKIKVYPYKNKWGEVDSIEDLNYYNNS